MGFQIDDFIDANFTLDQLYDNGEGFSLDTLIHKKDYTMEDFFKAKLSGIKLKKRYFKITDLRKIGYLPRDLVHEGEVRILKKFVEPEWVLPANAINRKKFELGLIKDFDKKMEERVEHNIDDLYGYLTSTTVFDDPARCEGAEVFEAIKIIHV